MKEEGERQQQQHQGQHTHEHKHRPNAGKFDELKGKIKPHTHAPGECKAEATEAKTQRLLFDAVKKGDVDKVKQLLSESPSYVNPDTMDSHVSSWNFLI